MSISLFQRMKKETNTRLWLDSIAQEEMNYALDNGAVGCTCNPVIILNVLKTELQIWEQEIIRMIEDYPLETEDELVWRLVKKASSVRAKKLLDIFEQSNGRNGRLSVQTDPRYFRNADRIVQQACEFAEIAPNIIVKIPATKAGIKAIEEATYAGVSINATVSFVLSQAIEVAEAVERGLKRREAEGKDVSTMGPVCTLMVGRLDDYFSEVAVRQEIDISPEMLGWCGIAVFKKAYQLYCKRGYRCRLLAAAFRSTAHGTELMGGDVVISPPYKWIKKINECGEELHDRIHDPVDSVILTTLKEKLPGFASAYAEDGITQEEFEHYPPSIKAIDQFADSCQELAKLIRGYLLR